MNFTVVTTTQRTPEWHAARLGRLTGSCADDMLAAGRGNAESVKRRDLRLRLACERLTGESQDDAFVTKEMQRGNEKEPDAFAAYEAMTGEIARPVGFLAHPVLHAGCSPDGQIGDYTGILELKCPKSATHLSYLRSQEIPTNYLRQITHNLWITGAQWCDFVSFDDRFPANLRLLRLRVLRTVLDIDGYERAATAFLGEVDREVRDLTTLAQVA